MEIVLATSSSAASKKRPRSTQQQQQQVPTGSASAVRRDRSSQRRGSGSGDEGEIDQMLEELGIPDSGKKKKQQQQSSVQEPAVVIELITPPRAARSAAVPRRFDGIPVDQALFSPDTGNRRETIVDLTSPTTPSSVEGARSANRTPVSMLEVAFEHRASRAILISLSQDELHPSPTLLSPSPSSPAPPLEVSTISTPPNSPPVAPSSDEECDAMLEDLRLARPLSERIAMARGGARNGGIASGSCSVESSADRHAQRESTIAQGGGFLYSSIATGQAPSALPSWRNLISAPAQFISASTTSAMASMNLRRERTPQERTERVAAAPATRKDEEESAPRQQQHAVARPKSKKKKSSQSPAPPLTSKREPVVAVVRLERTLEASAAGQALQVALQTHVYNNKPLVYEMEQPFDCMFPNVIQWERRESGRERGGSGSTAATRSRFFSVAIYFQAQDFLQLLEWKSYSEVLATMQFLKRELQARASRRGGEDAALTMQLSTFLIVEDMDRCLINHKKKSSGTQGAQFSFSDLHEMAFQLFMDAETHTKFTVDLDDTASYVAMLTREIVIAATKKTAQEDFLESVPRLHSFRVTSSGATMNTFANSWLRMLQMIPGVSEDKAQSIMDHFPTFTSLMHAYRNPAVSQEAKEDLLADKLHERNIERALSKRIFNVFCVDDPDVQI